MTRIFLIGYMGAGKTTLGKAFARAMGLAFVDLDWYIEERFHKTIRQIFSERGEDGFRELEKRMLHEAGDFEDVVISVGGGTPCFFDNMDYMNQTGETVFLDVDGLFGGVGILVAELAFEHVSGLARAVFHRGPFAGHGGALDRFDSVLAVSIVVAAFEIFVDVFA